MCVHRAYVYLVWSITICTVHIYSTDESTYLSRLGRYLTAGLHPAPSLFLKRKKQEKRGLEVLPRVFLDHPNYIVGICVSRTYLVRTVYIIKRCMYSFLFVPMCTAISLVLALFSWLPKVFSKKLLNRLAWKPWSLFRFSRVVYGDMTAFSLPNTSFCMCVKYSRCSFFFLSLSTQYWTILLNTVPYVHTYTNRFFVRKGPSIQRLSWVSQPREMLGYFISSIVIRRRYTFHAIVHEITYKKSHCVHLVWRRLKSRSLAPLAVVSSRSSFSLGNRIWVYS